MVVCVLPIKHWLCHCFSSGVVWEGTGWQVPKTVVKNVMNNQTLQITKFMFRQR